MILLWTRGKFVCLLKHLFKPLRFVDLREPVVWPGGQAHHTRLDSSSGVSDQQSMGSSPCLDTSTMVHQAVGLID